MEKKLTLASWAILLAVAAWQSPGWWKAATDPRTDRGPVVQKAEPVAAVSPREQENKVRDPDLPYKLDLRDYEQNTEFLPNPFNAEDGGGIARNENGNAGPFDAEGNLILPLDIRNMH